MAIGIYKITNNLNHHFYIGQSKNIQHRWVDHRTSFKKKHTHYTVLQKAFKKYGINNFTFEIIEECPVEKLNEKEIFYISTLKPEYNMTLGGAGTPGHEVTEKMKKYLSNCSKRQWNSYDEETKKKVLMRLTGPKIGSHRSEETKKILAERTKAFFIRNGGMSKEQKEKISISLSGKKRPNYGHFKPIIGVAKNGMIVRFDSIKFASFILGISDTNICHCLKGKQKNAGGFTWKYCSPETIQFWSREDVITSRSAVHPTKKDEDIVHATSKNRRCGVHDKGLIALARRSNTIKTIAAECIYSNDVVDIELGMNRHLSHKIDITKERGEIIAYYCLVELNNGGIQFCVKTKKDIENHRNKFSKAYNPDDQENIWNKNFDAMALKTCVIQALKLCPISIEALEAVSNEEYKDVISNDDYSEDYSIKDTIEEAVVVEPKKIEVTPNKTTTKSHNVQQPTFDGMQDMELTPDEESMADAAFEGYSGKTELGTDIF